MSGLCILSALVKLRILYELQSGLLINLEGCSKCNIYVGKDDLRVGNFTQSIFFDLEKE